MMIQRQVDRASPEYVLTELLALFQVEVDEALDAMVLDGFDPEDYLTSRDIALDLVLHHPSFEKGDDMELTPYVRSWLARRR